MSRASLVVAAIVISWMPGLAVGDDDLHSGAVFEGMTKWAQDEIRVDKKESVSKSRSRKLLVPSKEVSVDQKELIRRAVEEALRDVDRRGVQ